MASGWCCLPSSDNFGGHKAGHAGRIWWPPWTAECVNGRCNNGPEFLHLHETFRAKRTGLLHGLCSKKNDDIWCCDWCQLVRTQPCCALRYDFVWVAMSICETVQYLSPRELGSFLIVFEIRLHIYILWVWLSGLQDEHMLRFLMTVKVQEKSAILTSTMTFDVKYFYCDATTSGYPFMPFLLMSWTYPMLLAAAASNYAMPSYILKTSMFTSPISTRLPEVRKLRGS